MYIFRIPLFAGGCSWNSGGCCDSANADDKTFLVNLVGEIASRGCVDTSKVFAVGYSAGGYMALTLGCQASSTFKGVGTVGALIGVDPENASQCAKPFVRYLSYHSTGDPEVPYADTAKNGDFMTAPQLRSHLASMQGCSANTVVSYQRGVITCTTHTGCPSGRNSTLCTENDNKHAWPGSSNVPGYPVYSGTQDDNASAQYVNFFLGTGAGGSSTPNVTTTSSTTTTTSGASGRSGQWWIFLLTLLVKVWICLWPVTE